MFAVACSGAGLVSSLLAICFEMFVKMHSNPPCRDSRNIVAFKGTGKQEDADYLMQEYIAGGMLMH